MPTTTNYGWTTPADTDLVKDGASAIRTLGTAIDTTVFNNASAGIAKTIVDAKGDIIAATAADTVSRLAVGANDTVLTADSSTATGLKWATVAGGGMTLLSTTTLSGASTTISSINQSYTYLFILGIDIVCSNSDVEMFLELNAQTNNHFVSGIKSQNFNAFTALYSDGGRISFGESCNTSANNRGAHTLINIFNYTSTNTKVIEFNTTMKDDSNYIEAYQGVAFFKQTSAITSLKFSLASGTYTTGTIQLYGVK